MAAAGPLSKYVQWVQKTFDFKISVHHYFTFVWQKTLKINLYYYWYRWFMVILCLISSVVTLADLGNPNKTFKRDTRFYFMYFIYLTNLSLTLNTIQVTFGVIIMTIYARRYKLGHLIPPSGEIGRFRIVYWKLHELTTMVALSVSTTYWLVVYPVSNHETDMNSILGHAMNSLYAVVDWAVTGLPYNFSDVWMGWAYATCYFIFTLTYWEFGGWSRPSPEEEGETTHVLYPKCSDWSNVKQVFLCFFGYVCILSMWHTVLCALNRVRIIFWKERTEDLLQPKPITEPVKIKVSRG